MAQVSNLRSEIEGKLETWPTSKSSLAKLELDAANLRPPSCDDTRGSTPKVFGVNGPAVLPLFCLAPHGVFPASRITPRAVSSYLAISPLPAPRRGKLTASPTLPKNRRCLFCDTFRHRNFATAGPASFTRHAAVWCSDFPLANLAIHQRSSAIGRQFSIISSPGNQELIGRLSEISEISDLRCRNDLPVHRSTRSRRRLPDRAAACLRLLALLRLGAGLFGDVTGAVERALHPVVF